MSISAKSEFAHSRSWDFITGLPCVLFCLFAASGFAILIGKQIHQPLDLTLAAQIFSETGSLIFFSMQAALICVRRLPARKLTGLVPRLTAFLAAYSSFALVLLPRAAHSTPLAIASSALLLVGTLGSIVTLIFLGRSFAILPQARRLVVSGPYRYSRHPLYLCEQLSLFGVSLQFQQPWALLLALVGCMLQFPRMHYEERVLLEAFPEYFDYRKRTALLIPGIGPVASSE
jgi:protein-S-isoprenylcysteine O-methyltransferase Ste14